MLVPNKHRLDAHLADALLAQASASVIVHPAVAVLSQWVEQLCVKIQLLRGEAVCQTASPALLQMFWQNAMPDSSGFSPEAEKRLSGRQARTADKWLRQWYPDQATPWLDGEFVKARKTVSAEMRRYKVLDAEGWTQQLIRVLEQTPVLPKASSILLPEQIVLDGFHELTTLEKSLLGALERHGVQVQNPNASVASTTVLGALRGNHSSPVPANPISPTASSLRSYPDSAAELAAAAHWAHEQWAAGKQRIAVVFNELDNQVQSVRRSFENVFYPHHLFPDPPPADECVYHLSAGEPLLEVSVVESALMLLQLSVAGPRSAIPFSRFSNWILSPYWGGADAERQARAQLEVSLRREGVFQLLPASLHERAAAARLSEDLSLAVSHSRAALAMDWRREDALYHCLEAWAWPGPLASGERNQNAIRQFLKCIENLRELPLKTPAQALAMLRQMCAESRLAGAGGPLSPVQILSPDDAAGRQLAGQFDAAWVANVHERNWPGSPLSNPYLPSDVAQFIPRASHEGELAWTRSVSQALRGLAPELVFSWGQQSGDLELGPSPLLTDIPITEKNPAPSSDLHQLLLNSAPPDDADSQSPIAWQHYGEHPFLKARKDDRGLPLQAAHEDLPAEAIRGGAAAINDQSALPLLGYLRHRLNARFDPMPDAFADAALRGSLLHSALQQLYQPCLGTANLPDASSVPAAVESALRERSAFHRLSALQYESERMRLIRVLEEWLEKDCERSYARIYALEQGREANLCGHPIRVRADRIDQLDDGSLLIIDYKSSKRDSGAWARSRLGEAQVPLYARLLQEEQTVGGIALATVRHGECLLDGVVQDSAHDFDKLRHLNGKSRNLDKRFADWPAAIASWQQSIDALATEIIQGLCSNVLYDRNHPGLEDFQLLLRHEEGEAWLQQQAPGGEKAHRALPMGSEAE